MTSQHSVYSVLLKPIISEKSNQLRENNGIYTFQIRLDATKEDVKRAVNKAFNVKVETVRTVLQHGKTKRRGATISPARRKKKAFVTLVEGQKINLFEDQ
jgi:large subunit ribosomal protein L23